MRAIRRLYHYPQRSNIDFLSRVRYCTPVAFAVTTAALTAVAGGVAAYGKREEGIAAENQYRYGAAVMNKQKEIARRTADINKSQVVFGASQQAKNVATKEAEVMGAQKAVIGANMGGGSVTAGDILTDTMTRAQKDKMAIKYNADSKIWGIENDVANEIYGYDVQKEGYLKAAKNARRAGDIGMATSLLSTATSTASAYGRYGYSNNYNGYDYATNPNAGLKLY